MFSACPKTEGPISLIFLCRKQEATVESCPYFALKEEKNLMKTFHQACQIRFLFLILSIIDAAPFDKIFLGASGRRLRQLFT